MKTIFQLIAVLCTLFSTAQPELDFDMDVNFGRVGGYADVTYTITNISSNTINNLSINHTDAVNPILTLNPSTLAPGATVIATGKIAISGDRYNGNIPFLGSTQATANGIMNGTAISELSDGIDFQGNRVDDGASDYQISTPERIGVVYIDDDSDGAYTQGTDTTISNATINISDQNGNIFSVMTNETGWWNADIPDSMVNTAGDFLGTVDQSSFPSSFTNYFLIDGLSPFQLVFPLAAQFEFAHGYTDQPASIEDVKEISAYPIPMTGNTLFLNNYETGAVKLYFLDGKEIWKGEVTDGRIEFDVLKNGFYILRVITQDKIASIKLLKK
ncbi:T9SS type A sorting domain-containing protein [Nonlabens sp. Asnod3-A02]|uniref:T9SS type A sorting domain-containing protein n=1 Tax=Nonlabens sp. Asnod3-A02 TaxID=3160579 RepID=UPI00386F140D